MSLRVVRGFYHKQDVTNIINGRIFFSLEFAPGPFEFNKVFGDPAFRTRKFLVVKMQGRPAATYSEGEPVFLPMKTPSEIESAFYHKTDVTAKLRGLARPRLEIPAHLWAFNRLCGDPARNVPKTLHLEMEDGRFREYAEGEAVSLRAVDPPPTSTSRSRDSMSTAAGTAQWPHIAFIGNGSKQGCRVTQPTESRSSAVNLNAPALQRTHTAAQHTAGGSVTFPDLIRGGQQHGTGIPDPMMTNGRTTIGGAIAAPPSVPNATVTVVGIRHQLQNRAPVGERSYLEGQKYVVVDCGSSKKLVYQKKDVKNGSGKLILERPDELLGRDASPDTGKERQMFKIDPPGVLDDVLLMLGESIAKGEEIVSKVRFSANRVVFSKIPGTNSLSFLTFTPYSRSDGWHPVEESHRVTMTFYRNFTTAAAIALSRKKDASCERGTADLREEQVKAAESSQSACPYVRGPIAPTAGGGSHHVEEEGGGPLLAASARSGLHTAQLPPPLSASAPRSTSPEDSENKKKD